MEVKFAHTTDWHFGQTKYRKTKRWEDIISAAKRFKTQVIELIRAGKLDFIIHSGDIYHSYHPSAGTVLQLYEILEEIRQAFVDAGLITEHVLELPNTYLSDISQREMLAKIISFSQKFLKFISTCYKKLS